MYLLHRCSRRKISKDFKGFQRISRQIRKKMFCLLFVLTSASSSSSPLQPSQSSSSSPLQPSSSSSSLSSSTASSSALYGESINDSPVRELDVPCQGGCGNSGICKTDGSCDCSHTSFSGRSCQEDSIAYKFEHPGGIIIITFNSSKHTKVDHVTFGMMTHQSDAILLSIESSPPADFIVFELMSGCVHVQFNMGLGNLHVGDSTSKINDGFYHVITFKRKGQNSSLQVDDGPAFESRPTGRQLSIFNEQKLVSIGGLLRNKILQPYHGIMAGLVINGEWLLESAAVGDNRMSFVGDVELHLTPYSHYFSSMFRQKKTARNVTSDHPMKANNMTNINNSLVELVDLPTNQPLFTPPTVHQQKALNDLPSERSKNLISEDKEAADIKAPQHSLPPRTSTHAPNSSEFTISSSSETTAPTRRMKNSPTIPSTPLPQTSTKLPYFANSLENISNSSKDPPLSSDHHQDHLVPLLIFLIFVAVVAVIATIVGFKTRCCHRGADSGSYRLESRRIEVGASNRQVGGTDFDDASMGGKSPRTSKRLQKRKNKKHKTAAKKLVDREWYV